MALQRRDCQLEVTTCFCVFGSRFHLRDPFTKPHRLITPRNGSRLTKEAFTENGTEIMSMLSTGIMTEKISRRFLVL